VPEDMHRVGVIAQLATAIAAVTYPVVKVISAYVQLRRVRNAQRFAAATAAVEARLLERCAALERRVRELEHRAREAA
jgi:hypothetical protein